MSKTFVKTFDFHYNTNSQRIDMEINYFAENKNLKIVSAVPVFIEARWVVMVVFEGSKRYV